MITKPENEAAPDACTPDRCPSSAKQSSDTSRRTAIGVCLFLLVAVLTVFGQTLWHDFVNLDDNEYVYENPSVAGGLTWKGVAWAFTHIHSSNWHPITWMSHMLDCEFYGLNPAGHHLTNVLLHAATAILLFLALLRLTSAPGAAIPDRRGPGVDGWCCAFVAVLFAIHPLRVESVAWVAERKDVLSGFFFMLTLLAYARYVRKVEDPLTSLRRPLTSGAYWLVVFCFTLGLMSKPMLVTLPFVLILLDYWPLGRLTNQSPISYLRSPLFLEKFPLFLLSAASCALTVLAQKRATVEFERLTPLLRIGNALTTYVTYVEQMLWPAGLVVYYPHPVNRLPLAWMVFTLVLLGTFSAGVFALRRNRPYLATGWLWYLGILVPVIGLMQVGGQAHADRYTYLPQIGLYIILAWGVADLTATWRHRGPACGAAAGLVVAVLMACAWLQTSHWRDSTALWTRALAFTSDNQVAHNNLAAVLLVQGKSAGAIENFRKALEINPDYLEAHNNLATVLAFQGKSAEAIGHYQRALEINPDSAAVHFNLAIALVAQGSSAEAIEHYRQALQINPDHAEAHNNLATVLASQGKSPEAIGHYQQAVKIKPDYAEAHNNLAAALASQGKSAEAIGHFRRALEINPGYAEGRNNLTMMMASQERRFEVLDYLRRSMDATPGDSWVLENLAWMLATCPDATLRNGPEALELARQANNLSGGADPGVLDILAASYAEEGLFPEAVKTARLALDLAQNGNNPTLTEAIRSRLQLYEMGFPFHEMSQRSH